MTHSLKNILSERNIPDKKDEQTDIAPEPATQQQLISEALVDLNNPNDVYIRSFPHNVQRMLKYIHAKLFETMLAIQKTKVECRLSNNDIATKFRWHVGLGTRE